MSALSELPLAKRLYVGSTLHSITDQLSTNFNGSEFRCKGFGHEGHEDHVTLVRPELLWLLQTARNELGRPMRLISAHRCRWWNSRQPRAATDSWHIRGGAVDWPTGLITPDQAEVIGFGGIGINGEWATHSDVRPQGLFGAITWRYD